MTTVVDTTEIVAEAANRLVKLAPPGANAPLVVALETLPRIKYGLYSGPEVRTLPLVSGSVAGASLRLRRARRRPG